MADGQTAICGSKILGHARMAEITAAIGEEMAAGFKRGFGHACVWRVPPHWSVNDWREELCALAIMSAWQASRDFDQSRGIPLAVFVCCRIKACVLTRYRQEWRYALRNTPADSETIESLAGSVPATQADPVEFLSLDRALGRLSEGERWLLAQLFWNHRTETAVAAELGISQPAVNKRKRVALFHLRSIL
jgi:DNA-directed RNA polymerase specialized sigma subunit